MTNAKFGIKECAKCEYNLRCQECIYNKKDISRLIAETKADTVKKMRERLYRELAFLGAKDKFNKEYFLTEVDRVAKEILKGGDTE